MSPLGHLSDLLKVLTNFLTCRKHNVVLNGQYSSGGNVEAGVCQDSILASLIFLICINDLSDNLSRYP